MLFLPSRSKYTAEDGVTWQVLTRTQLRESGVGKDEVSQYMKNGWLVEFRAFDKKGTAHILYAIAGEPLKNPNAPNLILNDQDPNPQTPGVQP
jgi:hypothetical protein